MVRLTARVMFRAGVCAVIWLSLKPSPQFDFGVGPHRQHLPAYTALGVMGASGFPWAHLRIRVGLGLASLGASLNVAKTIIPGRESSLVDGGNNLIGVGLGMALALASGKLYDLAHR